MSRLQAIFSQIAWKTGFSNLIRRTVFRDGRFVLAFHGIADLRYDHIPNEVQTGLDVQEFRTVLTWLANHFNFLTPAEFVEGSMPGVLLTFDDGLANNVTNGIPVLEAFSAPAIFFVTTQHVQDPHDWLPASRKLASQVWDDGVYDASAHELFDGMSEPQLLEASRHPLITIGSHTVTHPFLTSCSDEQLGFELTESRRYLQALSGQSIDYFAYPTNDYDRRVAEAVRSTGYAVAFAVKPARVGLPNFEVPRIDIYQSDAPYLSMKLSGLHRPPIRSSYC